MRFLTGYCCLLMAGIIAVNADLRADDGGVSGGDASLAVQYAFDEGDNEWAKDLSGLGNRGQVVRGEILAECNGRRGVLRLDGKSSYISIAHSESLSFGGDLSLEMWVRVRNDEMTSGTMLGWGRNFELYGTRSIMVNYREGGNTMRMELAAGDRILSREWSHLAVVVEYPRLRLYHNGRLFRDSYMPIRGLVPDSSAKVIGQGCAVDLDEVRIYRRALTAGEVASHARGGSCGPGRDEELAVEPHWYEGIAALRLCCKGTPLAGHAAEIALLRGDGSEAIAPKRAVLLESSEGSGRYVGTVEVPLDGIQGGVFDARARIIDPAGNLFKTIYQHADLKKPEWVHNREGYPEKVPAPWTPVEVGKDWLGRIQTVEMWGRSYQLGSTPFLRQIQTAGEGIVAGPLLLPVCVDGQEMAWKAARPELTKSSELGVSLDQRVWNDALSANISSTVEFDGYMIFDCEIKALRGASIDALALEIPIHTRYATLCFGSNVYPEKTDPEIPMSVLHMGAVGGDLSFRFSPNIWLGNEDLGLTWQAESDEDWQYADPQKAIEILPRGDVTTFRAHWVDTPTKLAAGETLRYRFALQATPVKPLLRDAWDLRILRSDPYTGAEGNADLNLPDRRIKLDHLKADRIYSVFVDDLNLTGDGPDRMPALDYYAKAGARHLWVNAYDNWPWPMPYEPEYRRALLRLVNAAHAGGMKIYSYLIHERMPTNVPEFDVNGLDMVDMPLTPYEGTVAFCARSMAAQDAIVYNMARRIDEFGDDGVYLDGTGVHLKLCANTVHGCGYRAKGASAGALQGVEFDQTKRKADSAEKAIRPTYPVFAEREFIKRLYCAIKQRRPNGVLDVHSWYLNSAGLAYADMLWSGEQWWHLRGKGVRYVAAELTLDKFRTMFMGRQIGVAAEVLPYRLIGSGQKNSQVAATSLLHDIPVRIRTQDTEYFDLMSRLWKVREEFGIKDAEKLFYWNNAGHVQVLPEKCYATLFKHPRNGVLAFVSNLGPDSQTVMVCFNLKKLGFAGGEAKACNALTNEPVSMTTDGKASFSLGSEEWLYVRLEPAGGAGTP